MNDSAATIALVPFKCGFRCHLVWRAISETKTMCGRSIDVFQRSNYRRAENDGACVFYESPQRCGKCFKALVNHV